MKLKPPLGYGIGGNLNQTSSSIPNSFKTKIELNLSLNPILVLWFMEVFSF